MNPNDAAAQPRSGDRFVLDDVMHVEVTVVRDESPGGRGPEVEYRALNAQDAIDLGWAPLADGQYEALSYLSDFLSRTTPIILDLVVGAIVVWVDVATGKVDPTHGTVEQIVSDPGDAFPVAVRWADAQLYRHARNELRVVSAGVQA